MKSISKRPILSLYCLNFAQMGAVINDNIYKLVMVFLLIDILGASAANNLLAVAGIVFVIPFLLFSSAAGILADRYCKKKMISTLKFLEVVIFILAIILIRSPNPYGLYFILFLLGTHSALFSPAKYGIIPELVPSDYVARANGIVTAWTYLGIISGTFLASFLTQITHRHYIYIMCFCLGLAILGYISSLFIHPKEVKKSKRNLSFLFLREILETLRQTQSIPNLFLVIMSSAFFLLIGTFTQLNIIPYTIQGLHRPGFYGGYLFFSTALGIAIGAYIIGKLLKTPIQLRISSIAGIGMGTIFFFLSFFYTNIFTIIILLFLLGFFGGFFTVPLDTFVQLSTSSITRGHVIATANFLSFCGVLVASLLLYIFGTLAGLSAMWGFFIMGVLSVLYSTFFFFSIRKK